MFSLPKENSNAFKTPLSRSSIYPQTPTPVRKALADIEKSSNVLRHLVSLYLKPCVVLILIYWHI